MPSADGVLRVVSCSALIPIKRVDVLARGLMLSAHDRPDRSIAWDHTGDGPLRPEIEGLLRSSAPSNLSWGFRGQVANAEVFNRYHLHPADLFANTSYTEGIPVSIMEAQSCGIPAMAPSVGGMPEIVSPENGWLLPSPASPAAVAKVINAVLATPQCLSPRRARSRRDWEERFDARRNLAGFARNLSDLRRQFGGSPL
jgi:glycosyltransferase involved in cell wall biosynthesis